MLRKMKRLRAWVQAKKKQEGIWFSEGEFWFQERAFPNSPPIRVPPLIITGISGGEFPLFPSLAYAKGWSGFLVNIIICAFLDNCKWIATKITEDMNLFCGEIFNRNFNIRKCHTHKKWNHVTIYLLWCMCSVPITDP